jgi:hypothetical protein
MPWSAKSDKGGLGVVLNATEPRDGRPFALKLIKATAVGNERARIAVRFSALDEIS